ncbi:LysE family transporter [Anaerotignum sp. MB30-C6]|uniref:LysE family transporter n=1 Tax=Anaerotignum sp. MB30-C6 TaxID=3070814 RepID=UPI0027DDFA65|nr:LysE family transporter [Anaerotignum sp. MB30-C6]WMI80007.1 LysE family transporter [Anaerotignum sp. MB30-C6]
MLLKGFRFGMLLQIAVGPVCLFIFQTAVTSGLFPALLGVIGITIIDSLYILGAIMGIGAFINKYDRSKIILKYFGSAVLVVFGLSIALDSFEISLVPSINYLSKQNMETVFFKTLALALSNPLTIIFWAGVFSAKVAEENMEKREQYFFGIGAVLSTVIFLTTISILGCFLNRFLGVSVLNSLNMVVGLILIGLGVKSGITKKVI